jgi:ubiquitin-protein ligase E3 C
VPCCAVQLSLFFGIGSKLKRRVQIVFESNLGYEEAGVDGGGVFKEFLTDLSKVAFDPNRGLFQTTSEQLIYPNPHE